MAMKKAADERRRLAEAVRRACILAALDGYEDASLSGLCHEGAWERAIDAIRSLNLQEIIGRLEVEQAASRAGQEASG